MLAVSHDSMRSLNRGKRYTITNFALVIVTLTRGLYTCIPNSIRFPIRGCRK
jgi:hypothetical protein